MANPSSPNYNSGVGRLVTDRYDFQDHVDGYNFKHNAGIITLNPPVLISTTVDNVQDAIVELRDALTVPVVADATTVSKGVIQIAGDIGGSATYISVIALRGFPVASTPPTNGYVLTWNGSSWAPASVSAATTLNGDVTGTAAATTVVKLNGKPIVSTTPNTNDALVWNGSSWNPVHVVPTGTGFVNVTAGAIDASGTANIRYTGGKFQTDTNIQFKSGAFTGDLAWTPSANYTLTLPQLTDTIVSRTNTETLTNKTINITDNSVTATGNLLGDLIKNDGSKFVRFARGTALQVLRVNAGGTDLEWASVAGISSSGSSGTIQISDGAGAFLGANNVLGGTNYISIGSLPATSGALRVPYSASADILVMKDSLNANQNIISQSGADTIRLGPAITNALDLQIAGDNISVYSGTQCTINADGYEAINVRTNNTLNGSKVQLFGGVTGADSYAYKYIEIANSDGYPTATPTGGGYMYVDAGALKWKGTSGTLTTMGPADPHCKKCGRDFMHEWTNTSYGYLSTCMPCLLDALEIIGIDVNAFSNRKLN